MLGLPTVQGALTPPPARTLLQEWADSRDDQLSNHSLSAQGSSSTWRPNVLYLIADDLRTELGAYGQKHIRTPHLDKLAAGGLLFDRAYCQLAICGPSRNSFLTGRRPDSIRVWNFRTDFRQTSGDSVVTLPQLFRNNGYHTAFSGKIFHDDLPQAQDPPSWTVSTHEMSDMWTHCNASVDHLATSLSDYYSSVFASVEKEQKEATVEMEVPICVTDSKTDEDIILRVGAELIGNASDIRARTGQPWFVAIGSHRPHTDWRLPPEWDPSRVDASGWRPVPPAAKHLIPPKNAPYMALNWAGGDGRFCAGSAQICRDCPLPLDVQREFRRWYYAACEYVDLMLGVALTKLDSLGPLETGRTITIFHSDHGYHLGEQNEWAKRTTTEMGTRVPLIIRVPWKRNSLGQRTSAMTELVDVYRTLAELSGFDPVSVASDVDGESVAALFDEPANMSRFDEKLAISQLAHCECSKYTQRYSSQGLSSYNATVCDPGTCDKLDDKDIEWMGYSLRAPSGWRYTAWLPWNGTSSRPLWDSTQRHDELYDLRADPGNDFDFDGYAENVAEDRPAVVADLFWQLRKKAGAAT